MHVCPKGHQSQAGDYCDVCGTPIAATRSNSASGTPSATSSAAPGIPTGAACPDCDAPQSGRFCEVCGYDFMMAKIGGGAKAMSSAPVAVDVSAASMPGSEPVATNSNQAGDMADEGSVGQRAGETGVPGSDLPRRTPPPPIGWALAVSADADYHARMQAQAEPDAAPIPLPAFVPPRRFALSGAQALIGRRSRSRGIEPEIDLSGPPADPAVSHAHALLLADPDGSLAVVDLESANGTFVNDEPDPIEPNVPRQLVGGDQVHLGAWTTITLSRP